jgi:predicted ATPase
VLWDASEAREREARAAVAVPHRLPAEVDSFVGREVELARLAERFRGGTRLVTLQGPGGIGKTRLANRYGWRSLGEWPGGAWFCDLTEARSKDGIAAAVAEGLGVTLGAGDPVAQLSHAIARRGSCLVILDNFEQVVRHAAETVAPWLASAPEVRILATSRERLELRGEEVEVIEALPIERGVELFVERARRQRTIELDGPEGASVREVVRLLEGIPLAIELSAGRLRVMTPAQMVERIAERFRILAGTGGGRHATLRAAIDGSWELLQPWEKAAFAQCAVFEGGFGLEAAEAVLDLHAWPEAPRVIDVLQSLVDKSLIRSWMPRGRSAAPTAPRPAAQPAMRFGMFVSLQEYAREKLASEGAIPADGSGIDMATATERRHGRWFARFGQDDAIDALDREGGVERRQALATELDNLTAACRRTAALGDGQAAVGSYRAAWAVIELQGPLTAAVEMGTQVLLAFRGRGHDSLAAEEQAQLLHTLGRAKQRAGRLEDARADLEASLAIDRKRGDRQGEGRTLAILATLPLNNGRLEEARAQLESALVIHREVGDRRAEGIALGNLGLAHHEQGRLEDASVQLEAALSIHREIGNRRSEGIVRGNLGNLRREQGRMEEARTDFEAALAIHREVGNRRFEAIVLGNLGSLNRNLGRWEEARTRFAEALAIHREVGARRFEGEALDNLANVSLAQGAIEDAGALYAAALAIHREVGNRRAEGIVLIGLSALRLEQGRLAEAREYLSQGEGLLASAQVEARPDSELGRRLTTLRQALIGV